MKHEIDDAYSAYGESAARKLPPIMVGGRHLFHESAMAAVADDVAEKLTVRPASRLLEIGCNMGLLLRPLAARAGTAIGIDHPSIVSEFQAQGLPGNLTLLAGRFPDVRPDGEFDQVLVYSVVHYLAGAAQARQFIFECAKLLKPGGRLLIGDLPNNDAKRRFDESNEGRVIKAEYETQAARAQSENPAAYQLWDRLGFTKFIDDSFVFSLSAELRGAGFESYLLPQPSCAPFWGSREDLLVRRRG